MKSPFSTLRYPGIRLQLTFWYTGAVLMLSAGYLLSTYLQSSMLSSLLMKQVWAMPLWKDKIDEDSSVYESLSCTLSVGPFSSGGFSSNVRAFSMISR
jgi:hypothetical protein